jgi:aspartyl-tRNA(Asn)/glutamyl-tRNA(Gln) amidotransferase subunit C
MPELPIRSVRATTAQANTFIALSGVRIEVAVELKVQVTIEAPTITAGKRVTPTYSDITKESIKILPSATVSQWRRVARLARVAINDDETVVLCSQLDSIMSFVGQLNQVDVAGIEPMTSVTPIAMKMREDKVTDGGIADDILRNAPAHEDHFFVVPKVVE